MTKLVTLPAALVLAASIVAATAAPAGAVAHRPGITATGGSQKLSFSNSVLNAFKAKHIKLTAKSPATYDGKVLIAPIKNGTFSLSGAALLNTAGGLTISKGGKHVTISQLHSNGTTGVGTARVSGHGRIKALLATQPTHNMLGNPVVASGYTVKMAPQLVRILDNNFNTHVFKKHAKLGTGTTAIKY